MQEEKKSESTNNAMPSGGGTSGTHGTGSAGLQGDKKPVEPVLSATDNGGGASGTHGNGSGG